ncbi:MAG: hypothetical protein A2V93_11890 [Ignavibacteria bacterium RBG_16_34_14]|nr:MAG: hypothetical protein A2V93_11890 [Ignavibacteria bacterium RBG_16_34_14]
MTQLIIKTVKTVHRKFSDIVLNGINPVENTRTKNVLTVSTVFCEKNNYLKIYKGGYYVEFYEIPPVC